jgi:asparagine synthase (glutamine-hydrolysing)
MPFSYLLGFDMLDKKVLDKYPNTEMFTIAGRGLLAGACTQLLRRHYTGYASPFEDVDFYDFFLSIPLSIRGKGKILDKWILDRYPQAYDIISDSLMCKPSAGEFTKKIKRLQKSIKGKFAQIFSRWYPSLKRNNMNPMEYWYKTNSELRSFIHQYYNDNVDKLDIVPKAKELVAKLFNQGNTTNKLQALTVLGVVKKYF